MKTLLVDALAIKAYEHQAGESRAIAAISAQLAWLHARSQPTLFVEMWMEDGVPQLRVHAHHSESFEAVRDQLLVMKARLAREIADGPSKCPFAPGGTNDTATREA